jgi:hypothetical protein
MRCEYCLHSHSAVLSWLLVPTYRYSKLYFCYRYSKLYLFPAPWICSGSIDVDTYVSTLVLVRSTFYGPFSTPGVRVEGICIELFSVFFMCIALYTYRTTVVLLLLLTTLTRNLRIGQCVGLRGTVGSVLASGNSTIVLLRKSLDPVPWSHWIYTFVT